MRFDVGGPVLEQRWIRYGAWAGIAFVVVAVAAGAVTGSPPRPDDADRVFKGFFVDSHDQLLIQAWMYALAASLLLWFAAAVRRVLNRGDVASFLGDLFFAGVTATAGLVIVAMAMQIAVVSRAERLTPEVVRAVGLDFGAAIVALLGFFVALSAMSFTAAVFAGAMLPRWTAWLAIVALALNVVGTVGVFAADGAFSIEGSFTVFVPVASTAIWYLATSIAMLRSSEVSSDAAPSSSTEPRENYSFGALHGLPKWLTALMDNGPVTTPRYRQVLERAEALGRADGYVGVEHLMLAVLADEHAVLTQVLSRYVEPSTVATALTELMASPAYRRGSSEAI